MGGTDDFKTHAICFAFRRLTLCSATGTAQRAHPYPPMVFERHNPRYLLALRGTAGKLLS
jgi:hypothetical protein